MLDIADPEATPPAANIPHAMRAELAQHFAARKPPGLIARLFKRGIRPETAPPRACCIVGVMMLVDRGVALDGLVMELSETEILFRQASTFILDRTGSEVTMRLADIECRGRVTLTTPAGYRVRLAIPFDAKTVDAILSQYTAPDIDAA